VIVKAIAGRLSKESKKREKQHVRVAENDTPSQIIMYPYITEYPERVGIIIV
jgi:hypothetical protein